jgi:hypothetical protein
VSDPQLVGPADGPSDLAVEAARLAGIEVGVSEDFGPNDGLRVRLYQATVGILPPKPYCAGFVAFCIKSAAAALKTSALMKFSARALGYLEKNPDLRLQAPTVLPCLAIWDHGRGEGHIAFVLEVRADGTMTTVEGNTSPGAKAGTAASREGQGVYRRTDRTVASVNGGWIRIA